MPFKPANPNHRVLYRCRCGASVGTHPNGHPLGTLADEPLREARKEVHRRFDKLWTMRGGDYQSARRQAYRALRMAMSLSEARCHIGQFTVAQCEQAVALLETGVVQALMKAERRRRQRHPH